MANAPTLKFYCCSVCRTATAKPSCPRHPEAVSTLILADEVSILEDTDHIVLYVFHKEFGLVITLKYLPPNYEPLVHALLKMLKDGASVSGEPLDWSYVESVMESWFPTGFYPCV